MLYLIRQGREFLYSLPKRANGYMPTFSLNTAAIFQDKDIHFTEALRNTVAHTDDSQIPITVETYAEYQNAIGSLKSYYHQGNEYSQKIILNTLTIIFRKDAEEVLKDFDTPTKA